MINLVIFQDFNSYGVYCRSAFYSLDFSDLTKKILNEFLESFFNGCLDSFDVLIYAKL